MQKQSFFFEGGEVIKFSKEFVQSMSEILFN